MSCPQRIRVEALHDRRLAANQAEALRLHLVTCAACSEEAGRLEGLGAKLAALPEPAVSPLRVAAGRRRLLDAARGLDDEVPPGMRSRPFARLGGFALAACVAAAGVWFVLGQSPFRTNALRLPTGPSAPDGELALSVTPAPGAAWSRTSSGVAETLGLTSGELGVRVTRHGTRRLLVALPDGELEDVGTVFTVEVRDGKTRVVTVSEGRVALRLRGRDELVLSAGESFRAPDDAAADASAAPASPDAVAPDAARAPAAATKNGAHSSVAGEESAACPSASLFQDGVQAFKRSEYASAATLLARFSAECGRSNHGEDAAYLRMVALARAGNSAEAREQARAYLAHFPSGFRRKEAERLAGAD
jgi:hypothetical protein